jgi:hypothetical protein
VANHLLNQAWRTPLGSLALKAVYVKLCDSARAQPGEDGFVTITNGILAEDCNGHPTTIRAAIKQLMADDRGLVVREFQGLYGRPSRYRIPCLSVGSRRLGQASAPLAQASAPLAQASAPLPTTKYSQETPTPPARASARGVGGLSEPDQSTQVWRDRVMVTNVRKDGERPFASARHEGECTECCDAHVAVGDPILYDSERGAVRHQTCTFREDAHALWLDPCKGERAGIAAEALGMCAGCGEAIKRGDEVVTDMADRLVHNRDQCYVEPTTCVRCHEAFADDPVELTPDGFAHKYEPCGDRPRG